MSDWPTIHQAVAIALTQVQSPYTTYPANFEAQFPQATQYAENRIYRAIPMLGTRTIDTSLTTTGGSPYVVTTGTALPLMVVDQLSLIGNDGSVIPYQQMASEWITRYWPQPALTQPPSINWQGGRYWGSVSASEVVIAPTVDAAYTVQITGLFQPTPMSATNTTTYLTTTYPELLEAGILVFLTGALTRNFGAQADEPKSAVSWEGQFQQLLVLARDEERRRRGLAPNVPSGPPQQEMARQAQ